MGSAADFRGISAFRTIWKDGARDRRWVRGDKIALLGVIVTLIGVVAAVSPGIYHALSGPDGPAATINSPKNGPVSTNAFGVTGTAAGLPADSQLWIFLQPALNSRWYPEQRVTVTDGRWSLPPYKLCPKGGKAQVDAIAIPDSAVGTVNRYIATARQKGYPGLAQLPGGAAPLAAVTVTVPGHDSCG